MDVPPVDEILARAVDEQISEQRALREAMESLDRRLTELEARYLELEERLGPLGDRLREVTSELVAVLRRELARIPDVLSDQREAIAADIRAALVRPDANRPPPTAHDPNLPPSTAHDPTE